MYSEWASLSSLIQNGNDENFSVLGKFPMSEGKNVAISVVKHLAGNLGISQAAEPSPLTTDREVHWCMEVVCFGLSLPLSEHDTIRDCVFVYCEWLSALHPVPKISVPKPVCEDPNLYARKMINHFHNLFIPRKGEAWPFLYLDLGADVINRQAVLCHRVLRTLQTLAQVSNRMSRETWESLLLFLLAINDTLLGPPTVKDDVGDQLCERVLSVLFEVWLLACTRCFPSPPLWKTFREMCMNWRHRMALIEQWNRANLVLTSKLLEFMYGPSFPELKVSEEDSQLIPGGMTNDCVAQSWFRFLHCIGNPVDLCHPAIISQTQKFLQFAITSEDVVNPYQHPCLTQLPKIFSKAIRGIAVLVDSFLGIAQPYLDDGSTEKKESSSHPSSATHSPTPPPQRRLAKSFSVAPSSAIKGMPKASLIGLTSGRTTTTHSTTTSNSGPSSTSSLSSMLSNLGHENRPPLAPARPKCNSILHMFGEWLFEAAHIGCLGATHITGSGDANTKRPSSLLLDGSVKKNIGGGNSLGMQSILTSGGPSFSPASSQPASLNDAAELPPSLTIEKFESGRAEALGALCRIFCAKKTGEEILPVYLARFYLALQQGLKIAEDRNGEVRVCGEVLSSILLNSSDLFRLDLDGVQVLVPYVLDALEVVLPDKELSPKSASVSKTELRRASIHLLLSMLGLPLHFQTLPIREIATSSDKSYAPPVTFVQLKPRLMNLLINALQVESDPQNTQMLLGGLLLSVQDAAAYEEIEQGIQIDQGQDTASNLLSSASDTMSSHSLSDYRSLTEDLPEDGDAAYGNLYYDYPCRLSKNSAHALFVRATYLVCHRLMSSWKTDLNVSLAALELLAGLARTHIRETDALECKRAVKWLCDYIAQQCSRPPPAHSKDLHSTIVAAFQTAATWLSAHPFLLHDKECLTTVLEVVELGISGTKSQGKPGEPVKLKEEKELKPASMRVRDAAETLLTVILEQVGYFPSPCGAESLSSLLDEAALLRHCRSPSSMTPPFHKNCCNSTINDLCKGLSPLQHFRYFVIENSTMLALLEEPLGVSDDHDSQPTVTLLIRGPFGRHAWSMQLRHLPRHKSGSKYHAPNPGRPIPMGEAPVRRDMKPRFFPESVDHIPLCKVDQSIPSLESTFVEDEKSSMEHSHLSRLVERQAGAEALAVQKSKEALEEMRNSGSQVECAPPPVCHEFQTARLFLSHFGFLSSESLKEPLNSPVAPLTALDINQHGFSQDLEALDAISCRTCDTVHLFYVRARQKTAEEILANVNSSSTVHPHFLEFLSSLGWPVSVHKHPGWSGHVSTSWRITESSPGLDLPSSDHGGSLYNGENKVLYWADVNSEVAFVVPTLKSPRFLDTISTDGSTSGELSSGPASFDRSFSDKGNVIILGPPEKPSRTFSLDLDRQQQQHDTSTGESFSPAPPPPARQRRSGRQGPGSLYPMGGDTKVLVVWLESFEDWIHVPVGDLLHSMVTGLEGGIRTSERDCFVIFLHALQTGLLRVKLQGPPGRMTLATPLVDGMVVSRRVLGTLVRQTSLNMCRRRRLENDSYHPPHVRRRLKIQEMTQKYMIKMSEPQLYTYLFSSPPS